jgi:EmrB/QacA subfamily drug resistance transporter
LLTPEILALASVVILGTVMTVLDATVVNVALATLGRDFGTSISTIQWVTTAYWLAFACVIPVTGWAGERFGAKRVWLAALGLFMLGSLLAGLSTSISELIGSRVLQGLGGGMILPLGQTILGQAAGPHRMGRVMSIVGVPMLLAPIFGPVIGGAIVDGASWRWIFLLNLPVGALALALAVRLLPPSPGRPAERLDVRGLALLSGGIGLVMYGLAEAGARGGIGDPRPAAALFAGLILVGLFAAHSLTSRNPLVDVRLLADRRFGVATATTFVLGTALFGLLLLLPLYYQVVRGESPLRTGLLLAPQGLGAMCAMPIAGVLTDRLGAGRVVPVGIGLALSGMAVYAAIGPDTGYLALAAALFVVGLGLGSTIMPTMAAAYQTLGREQLPRATSLLNTTQRIAGALGTALLAVVLQRALAAELPGFAGGLGEAARLASGHRADPGPALAAAFETTFRIAFMMTAVALVPALMLPRLRSVPGRASNDPGMHDATGRQPPAAPHVLE